MDENTNGSSIKNVENIWKCHKKDVEFVKTAVNLSGRIDKDKVKGYNNKSIKNTEMESVYEKMDG